MKLRVLTLWFLSLTVALAAFADTSHLKNGQTDQKIALRPKYYELMKKSPPRFSSCVSFRWKTKFNC